MAEQCNWYEPSCSLSWLKEEFKAFFLYVYDGILGGFAAMVELIPIPDFLANMHPIAMIPTVSWFLQPFEITYGLGAIGSAYVARFILRRIPAIG